MLSAYLDRELAASERDAVRLHLADCDACRHEERELRAFKGILLGVRAPEPAPDFERRLMSRLREEASVPVRASRFSLPSFRPLVGFQLAGLAAAGALAVLIVGHAPSPTPGPSPVVRVPKAAFDTETFARGYEAYARADDFAGGTGLLTSNDVP